MKSVKMIVVLATVAAYGCQTAEMKPVSVRFVPWSEAAFLDDATRAQLTSSAADSSMSADWTPYDSSVPYHQVNLWGGQFKGGDVTLVSTPLEPGHYTFVSVDGETEPFVQGWVQVRNQGFGFLDTLRRWQHEIPQKKEWVAFQFEQEGGAKRCDNFEFAQWHKQIKALEKLERRIASAIKHEEAWQMKSWNRQQHFVNEAELLILPGESLFARPTTLSAFNEADIAQVMSGEHVSKAIQVTNYDDVRMQIDFLNRLHSDWRACRNVMTEETDRLEQRKRFMMITDHVYNHGKRFVYNESRLQSALSTIEFVDAEMKALREQQLAIAFAAEVAMPDAWTYVFDNIQHDIEDQQAYTQAKLDRVEMLSNNLDEGSPKRVALHRQMQRYTRQMVLFEDQESQVQQTRVAVHEARNTSEILHRQGDSVMLTAIGQSSLPFHVHRALESDSLMTVRLQASQSMFAPSPVARTASYVEPCDP